MSRATIPEQKIPWISYFLVFSIVALTGFEYFYRAGGILILGVFLVALLYFLQGNFTVKNGFFIILLPFTALSLIQMILGYNQGIFTTLLLTIAFATYYFIVVKLGKDFVDALINITCFFCIISLVFFFLTYNSQFMEFVDSNVAIYFKSLTFGSTILQEESEISRNIVIYNFKNYAFTFNRNSGPFWEPGMYVVFINISLFLNLIKTKRFFQWNNIVFLITIITTFSTTGYIAALFVVCVYLLFYYKNSFNVIYIIGLIISAIYISELEFMQQKIAVQIKNSGSSGDSRFGAALVHLKVLSDYPNTGVGDGAARIISNYTDAESTANGITFVFVKYGLFFGFIYYILLFKSSMRIVENFTSHKILGYCFFALLIILAFSQDITVRHFYFFLIFFGLFSSSQLKRASGGNYRLLK